MLSKMIKLYYKTPDKLFIGCFLYRKLRRLMVYFIKNGVRNMAFRNIDMNTYARRKHFEYFTSMQYPYVGVTNNVDVTELVNILYLLLINYRVLHLYKNDIQNKISIYIIFVTLLNNYLLKYVFKFNVAY